uniref:N-acetyltransferase domain-containing protein n=1 Tax=Haemonchus contortus TaxID=6289 RepID=A0A7I4YAL2_HAECO
MDGVPCVEDHRRVTILIRQVGPRNTTVFNRIVDRLARQRSIQVSDNPKRTFHANFVTSVNAELVRFGELQAHRRVSGLIGVACAQPSTSGGAVRKSTSSSVDDTTLACGGIVERRRSSLSGGSTLEELRSNYDKVKSDYAHTLVDSRCILLGYDEQDVSAHFSPREIFLFNRLEESDELETGIREFMRAIYFVLESKRVDQSFEKLECPPCPILPEEEKFRVGIENKTSKMYKKCLGRSRKQNADYAMLTGLPQLALDSYAASMDLLKSSNDMLWFAGACEGWACAAMSLLYDGLSSCTAMYRVASMTPAQMRDITTPSLGAAISAVATSQHLLGASLGHQRHRSDENARMTVSDDSNDGTEGRRSRMPWAVLRGERSKDKIEPSAIIEKFEQALEHYSKYSFAAMIEYDCMMKAVSLYRYQRMYVDMETFHRDHIGKYLDDSFTRFDNHTKAAICSNSAALYREVGFRRKCSFFARLGVLFRLQIADGEQRTPQDYRAVYPILYRTLPGYGIKENVREVAEDGVLKGPIQLQIKALHEVYTAASRAELTDAAIRHLCHLIQVYYDDMEPSLANRLFDDLQNFVRIKGSPPQLNQRISVPVGNIILPSIQLTRFPVVNDPVLCPLPPHLAPTVIQAKAGQPQLFIYSPFQQKKVSNEIYWVVDCPGEVSILVYNCRPYELVVRELCLLADGCGFESVPVRLILPAANEGAPARIKLIGVPRFPGLLTITGYCCEVFGVKNVCKLFGPKGPLKVEVLPLLAVLQLESSLPRAPIEEDLNERSAEITVYSGQLFEHSLTVRNTSSTIAIRKVLLQVWQPKVSGGPSMIELSSKDDDGSFSLAPLEEKEIKFKIFGIDPTATADDEGSEERIVESVLPLASTLAEMTPDSEAHDLIPYTGRLLTCQFLFQYIADVTGPNEETYERTARLSIAVCVVPAVTVSAWHVLPGDGPFTRYIVVDVTNSTDNDAELVYSSNRRMNVLPKETCRVPLLSPCCSDVAGRAFHAATQKDSHMMQKLEVEKLRATLELHVAKHLDIRWTIPAMNLEGLVPVGALLSSVSLLKQLVLPAISLDISVNGTPYLSEDDISVGIGEIVLIKVAVISSLEYDFDGIITLECYQEISSFFGTVDKSENLLVIGQRKIPFVVPRSVPHVSISSPRCELSFHVMFRVEGIHKVRPQIVSSRANESLFSDEIFVSPVGFSVSTKAHQ